MGDTVNKWSLLTVARKMTPVLRLVPVVQLISLWAFYYAFVHYDDAAEALYGITKTQPRLPALTPLTGTAAVVTRALNHVLLWCSVLQGVAALLVPLLKRRRRICWALAFIALSATIATECIWGMIHGVVLVVNPGDRVSIFGVLTAIGVVALELPAFVVLFQGADQEIYYKQV